MHDSARTAQSWPPAFGRSSASRKSRGARRRLGSGRTARLSQGVLFRRQGVVNVYVTAVFSALLRMSCQCSRLLWHSLVPGFRSSVTNSSRPKLSESFARGCLSRFVASHNCPWCPEAPGHGFLKSIGLQCGAMRSKNRRPALCLEGPPLVCTEPFGSVQACAWFGKLGKLGTLDGVWHRFGSALGSWQDRCRTGWVTALP